MKAATLHGYDEALTSPEFVTYERCGRSQRSTKPTDVVVRIGGAGVCRTDLHIIEGVWRKGHVDVAFPHIMGHENAGWVEEPSEAGVESVKVGDPVICHPLVTSGHCLACRRGNDMHAGDEQTSPVSTSAGGYADYLLTGERSLIKLPQQPRPQGRGALHRCRPYCLPRRQEGCRAIWCRANTAVIIGAGGLGHIGIQSLAALCAAEIIVIDYSDLALGPCQGMWRPPRGEGRTTARSTR